MWKDAVLLWGMLCYGEVACELSPFWADIRLLKVAVVNPGAILDHDTILLQSVNGTAHGLPLVLYTPAVSFIDCTGIAVALRIGSGLWIM